MNQDIIEVINGICGVYGEAVLNSTNLFWVEKGSGQPLIMIHGFDSCFYTWRHLFLKLGKGVRIIAIDLPGFGLSGDDPENKYTLEYYSKTIQCFLDHLGIMRATFCGHSYGGLICQDFARRTPDRVKKIVLVALPVAGTARSKSSNKNNLMIDGYYNLATLQPEDFKMYRLINLRTPNKLRGRSRFPNLYDKKTETRYPCLVIWGEEDRIVSIKKAQTIGEQYKDVSIKTLKEAGHNIHEEKPDEFYNILFNFLNAQNVERV